MLSNNSPLSLRKWVSFNEIFLNSGISVSLRVDSPRYNEGASDVGSDLFLPFGEATIQRICYILHLHPRMPQACANPAAAFVTLSELFESRRELFILQWTREPPVVSLSSHWMHSTRRRCSQPIEYRILCLIDGRRRIESATREHASWFVNSRATLLHVGRPT